MANSKRRCKHCHEYVTDWIKLPAGTFCTAEHAIAWANAAVARANEKAYKARTAELKQKQRANDAKTLRATALLVAQELARISRADDNGYCTCVTCGHVGRWNDGLDGGHYIAKGSSSYWMLDPRNIWPQCKACNGNGMKFDGAESVYTLFMIDTFGREFVQHMQDMRKTVIKRTAQDYQEFIASGRAEIAEHKKRIGC